MRARNTVPLSFLLPGWLRAPVVPLKLAKELRELSAYWLVAVLAAFLELGGAAGDSELLVGFAWFAGVIATVALGAAAFGHEFTHRTVGLMLVQPVTRSELWARKMKGLAAAVAAIAGLRLTGLILYGSPESGVTFTGVISFLSLGCALLVAPTLALLTRSTLAGTVFTVVLPALSWQLANLVSFVPRGDGNAAGIPAPGVSVAVFAALVVAQWIGLPFLGRALFLRLEAGNSRGLAIRLPRWGTAVASRPVRTGCLGKVAFKELRLLAPALVVGLLYLLLGAADLGLQWLRGGAAPGTAVGSYIYAWFVSLLVGALACAEERQAGTLVWQLVQPWPAWKLWAVKAGVAMGVALLLAVGLPWLAWLGQRALLFPTPLAGLLGFGSDPATPTDLAWGAYQVLVLCGLGLYASSASPNALRALLWAVPAGLAFVIGFEALRTEARFHNGFVPFETTGRSFACPVGVLTLAVWAGLLLGLLFAGLAAGFDNFRRGDQRAGRVILHGVFLAGGVGLAALGAGGFAGVVRAWDLALPEPPPPPEALEATTCEAQLAAIDSALARWYTGHAETLPDDLQALEPLLEDPAALVCPADPARGRYEYRRVEPAAGPARSVQVRCPLHRGGTVFPRLVRPGSRSGPAEAAPSGPAAGPERDPSPDRLKDLESRVRLMLRYGLVPQTTNIGFSTKRYGFGPTATNLPPARTFPPAGP